MQRYSTQSLVDETVQVDSTIYQDDSDPWITARKNLQDIDCCVVSVCSPKNDDEHQNATKTECRNNPLEANLAVLQERLADGGPSDIDIRVRIDTTTFDLAVKDCLRVCSSMVEAGGKVGEDSISAVEESSDLLVPATALADLAMGMASFADDCAGLQSSGGVFLRIVCASSYRAHDPVFHTDKAPLRGYATLRGVGTEFVTHPCSPLEYLALRSLSTKLPRFGGQSNDQNTQDLRCAPEKEFIVMKGDYYYRGNSEVSSWWQRAFACVHRSPPGTNRGSRRVIVSFDLADGDDDREWYDVHQKRQWRAGMTQRKSKLVA